MIIINTNLFTYVEKMEDYEKDLSLCSRLSHVHICVLFLGWLRKYTECRRKLFYLLDFKVPAPATSGMYVEVV